MSDEPAVAIDAMGGDFCPLEPVRGAAEYARETGRRVLLVGHPDAIRKTLSHCHTEGADLEIVPAAEVIGVHESIASIRTKRDSSIHVGCRLVRDGLASALVSAGHTGALMAISKVVYGLLDGVDRPALPAPMPRRGGGYTILIDAGANVDCRPEHFRQFAVMGHHYARRVFGVENPRIALLSIGEEDSKGNDISRQVSHILRETHVNFIGNLEGNHLFHDRADVLLCDGFVGNVVLKVSEGIAEAILEDLREEMVKGPLRRLGALALRPVFRVLKKKMDYAEYGGVPLLGLKKISVVAHGRSSAKAIQSALRVADTATRVGIVEQIAREIEVLHEAEQRLGG
ncbi:MAG: phosphate acyltransferase PlsX [Acidobacteriota bacterium]|nr:MAG: phosphate acyltransferase PlsX [Acidobacteriota bacterium]